MHPSKIVKLARKFESLAQEAEPTITYDQQAYNTMALELKSVIDNFISRKKLPITTARSPFIEEKTENREGRVALSVIITQEDLDKYIRELNNEIAKLDSQYEGVRLYSYYDKNDPRRARI